MIETIGGDCRVEMRRLIGQSRTVHSIVTDPPYHLLSIVKRFGKEGSAAAQHGRDGAFNRISRGFAGQLWDGLDERGRQIAHDPRLWELCLELLLPGGFLLAFSSPKTGHRMATAIEDAGFIMHPFIGWINAQGLPKPHEVAPGWYHGQQTLRPALEPVYVGQRPYSERTGRENFDRHGVGGYHIDACRLEIDPDRDDYRLGSGGSYLRERGHREPFRRDLRMPHAELARVASSPLGKWPTNVATDGSRAVQAAFPDDLKGDSKARYFPAFGYAAKAKGADRKIENYATVTIEWTCPHLGPQSTRLILKAERSPRRGIDVSVSEGDSEWFTILYGSVISDLSRKGCEIIIRTKSNSTTESRILNWLTRSLTREFIAAASLETTVSGSSLVASAVSTTQSAIIIHVKTGFRLGANNVASNTLLKINVEDYVMNHPTQKPVDFLTWLIKLVTPEGGTVLDLFAGTGSTGEAALAAKCNAILIESDPAYVRDIKRRFSYLKRGNEIL